MHTHCYACGRMLEKPVPIGCCIECDQPTCNYCRALQTQQTTKEMFEEGLVIECRGCCGTGTQPYPPGECTICKGHGYVFTD